jgi:hypothetical protein
MTPSHECVDCLPSRCNTADCRRFAEFAFSGIKACTKFEQKREPGSSRASRSQRAG